jgi:hypothetical protein
MRHAGQFRRRFDLGHLAHRAGCGKVRDRCRGLGVGAAKVRICFARSKLHRAGSGGPMFASDPSARKPPNV